MEIDQLSIKLDQAKQIIAIPGFKRNDLLKIALAALSTLQLPLVSHKERQLIEREHRRLAFLGDRLLDAVLADYLFATHPDLTTKALDDRRQAITCRESLGKFAIKLGLPSVCSSWHRQDRKPPEEEPGVYGEMFEALVAVIYLDGDRNFEKVSRWLRDRFIQKAVESYKDDND
jgi:dsRNA-specific ribonuclease